MITRMLVRLSFVTALLALFNIHNGSGTDAKIITKVGATATSGLLSPSEKNSAFYKLVGSRSTGEIASIEDILQIRGGQAITKKKVSSI